MRNRSLPQSSVVLDGASLGRRGSNLKYCAKWNPGGEWGMPDIELPEIDLRISGPIQVVGAVFIRKITSDDPPGNLARHLDERIEP